MGYDSINIADATHSGIPVAYTPGLLDDAVADYAFALLLTLARRTHSVHQTMREGGWKTEWGWTCAGKRSASSDVAGLAERLPSVPVGLT